MHSLDTHACLSFLIRVPGDNVFPYCLTETQKASQDDLQIKELILRYYIFSILSLVHSLRSKHMKSGIS